MKSGYSVYWTEHALNELASTIEYLENHFTEKEIGALAWQIEDVTALISQTPYLYPKSDVSGVRRAVVQKYNTLYYRVTDNQVEILSFFSNRQGPKRRKLL